MVIKMNLYEKIEPYNKGYLKVSDIHEIYFEECGNKEGLPIVFCLLYTSDAADE